MNREDYLKSIEASGERRFFASDVRKMQRQQDGDEQVQDVIEGYAAKFNSETVIGSYWQFREKILPGAFDDVLQDDVRSLFNHDVNMILARSVNGQGTLTLSVDAVGLKYSFVCPNRSYAKDLLDAIEKGDVTQSSFAFKIKEQRWIEKEGEMDLREIVKFERLYDVSPVTYPAYNDTEVAKRSFDAFVEERKKEKGNSLSVAAAMVVCNKNSLI